MCVNIELKPCNLTPNYWRCVRNGFRPRELAQQPEFKSWMKLFTFNFEPVPVHVPVPLEKA